MKELKKLREKLSKEINITLNENRKLLLLGDVYSYQNNCNYIKGLDYGLTLMKNTMREAKKGS